MKVKVRRLLPDRFSRPRIRDVETEAIYVDVSLGDPKFQPVEYNLPGDWHTSTEAGEPSYRISREVEFVIAEEGGE